MPEQEEKIDAAPVGDLHSRPRHFTGRRLRSAILTGLHYSSSKMNASVHWQPEGQLRFRQEQSIKRLKLLEKKRKERERSVTEASEDVLRVYRRSEEELSATVRVVLSLVPERTLQTQVW